MRISDWSSDVCSSDLVAQCCRHLCVRPLAMLEAQAGTISCCSRGSKFRCCRSSCEPCEIAIPSSERLQRRRGHTPVAVGTRREAESLSEAAAEIDHEIGRASCRERVCQYV